MSKILVIYTGGTIGMRLDANGVYSPYDLNDVGSIIPEIAEMEIELTIFQLPTIIDSSNASPALWIDIVSIIEQHYDLYAGFLVLHGTDTMAYTASALSFMMLNLSKPVILTGSQIPISEHRSDGRENILGALEFLIQKRSDTALPLLNEVLIYFQKRLYRGSRSTKKSTEFFSAYSSPKYPYLGELGVGIYVKRELLINYDNLKPTLFNKELNSKVALFFLYPGVDFNLLKTLFSYKAVIFLSYGAGNTPTDLLFLSMLKEFESRDILIVNLSQCMEGRVDMNKYETGSHLLEYGVLSGGDMTLEATITKVMFLLGSYSNKEIKKKFFESLSGEISL